MFNLSVLQVWFTTFGWNHPGWFNPKFLTKYEVLTSWTYRVIPSKSFKPDMKYWQIKHTGWFHPSFEPDMKNWQIEHTGSFGWKHPVCSACLLHIWLKNFGLNHPVCSTCLFFMSDSKLLDLNQTWRTDKLNIQGDSIQKFWTRHEVLTGWT
jgi:hypothetical protein